MVAEECSYNGLTDSLRAVGLCSCLFGYAKYFRSRATLLLANLCLKFYCERLRFPWSARSARTGSHCSKLHRQIVVGVVCLLKTTASASYSHEWSLQLGDISNRQ